MTLEANSTNPNDITVSVVSHGHGSMIADLFEDIRLNVASPVRVILTINRPDADEPWANRDYPFDLRIVRNAIPKGFGANHNAALSMTDGGLFCALNPDIRLASDPFPALANLLREDRCGAVAPLILGPGRMPEDHARDFPSLFSLAAKALGRHHATPPPRGATVYRPHWIAGMFMMFRTATLKSVGGFDERYFLYYEDVDLCARLRERGFDITVCTAVSAVHNARRESRRNLRFAAWHLQSALRYLASHPRMAFGLYRPRP